MGKLLKLAAAAATAAILSLAAQAAETGLAGSEWGLEGMDKPYVRFAADGRVAGNGGCNRFTGGYTLEEEGRIVVSPLAVTRMACPEPAMSEEQAFLAALQAVKRWKREGTVLVLADAEGSTLLSLRQRDFD